MPKVRNQRKNELFIGKEFINIEGRTIKHPALIHHNANLNMNKTREDMIDLIGLDLETNHLTGELRLLGFYEGDKDNYNEFIKSDKKIKKYGYRRYFTGDLLINLIGNIKYAIRDKKNFAHWNKLDAYQMFRLFATRIDDMEYLGRSLDHFDHIAGDWDKKNHKWDVEPVIKIMENQLEVGIVKVIRGSMQFYVKYPNKKDIETCWSYNIAALYIKRLEKEARYDPDNEFYGRFTWYSKVDETAHLVDWDRFLADEYYREEIVLKSNCLDAKAAMALGYEIQKDFKEAFGAYPTSLISQGSHARSALVREVHNELVNEGYEGDNLNTKKYEEVSSISLVPHLDRWLDRYDSALIKDLYLMTCESYSGGQIDTMRYGYAKDGWYADIASAYPAVIQNLFDLRHSRIESGKGTPPNIENSYILVRGLVTIPESLQYHPITIKHPIYKDTNIRPTGTFYATYTSEEREFCVKYGATFRDESWVGVITEGKLSVLSHISLKLVDLRKELIKMNSLAEGQVKRIGNSLYGILFEAVPIHEDVKGDTVKIGYRAGEFWNSLYATYITSRTRIHMSEGAMQIEANGGKMILMMTDSLLWTGLKSDLPIKLDLPYGLGGIKKIKTLGFYEDPEEVKDIICFGSGRYGFKVLQDDGTYKDVSKRRGMVISDYGVDKKTKKLLKIEKGFRWSNFMKLIKHFNSTVVPVKTRRLISTGILRNSLKYKLTDLGRIVEEKAEIDLIAGINKRHILSSELSPEKIINGLVKTTAIYLAYNVYADFDYVDGTLPELRAKVAPKKMKSKKIRKREFSQIRQGRYRDAHSNEVNKEKRKKYARLRNSGLSAVEASLKSSMSWENIEKFIEDRGDFNVIL